MAEPISPTPANIAELQPSQKVLRQRIRDNPDRFNRILHEHAGLWLELYLKYEHQPRFYHWVLLFRKSPGEFNAKTVLEAHYTHRRDFDEERDNWIKRIIQDNRRLTVGQKNHLEQRNRSLNLATRFTYSFPKDHQFWGMPYEGQLKHLIDAVIQLKPLLDFFRGGCVTFAFEAHASTSTTTPSWGRSQTAWPTTTACAL